MNTITKTITIYTYDELSPKAQKRAREWLRESGILDDMATDSAEEMALEILHESHQKALAFGSAYCVAPVQGRGVWLAGKMALTDEALAVEAALLGLTSTQTTCTVASDWTHCCGSFRVCNCAHQVTSDYVDLNDSQLAFLERVLDHARDELSALEFRLLNVMSDEMEYVYDDENVEWLLRNGDNEYAFTEDGEPC